MTFALGIFDLFSSAIPGFLNLLLLGYVAARLHWIDPDQVGRVPGLLLVVAGAVLSYLLGHLTYGIGRFVERRIWGDRSQWDHLAEFLAGVPEARSRRYVTVNLNLLQSAAELHDREVAMEINRLRAIALMARGSAVPLGLSAVVAVVEFALGHHRPFAAASAVLLAVATFAALWQARQMGLWAGQRILRLCFWIPDIDARLGAEPTIPEPRSPEIGR